MRVRSLDSGAVRSLTRAGNFSPCSGVRVPVNCSRPSRFRLNCNMFRGFAGAVVSGSSVLARILSAMNRTRTGSAARAVSTKVCSASAGRSCIAAASADKCADDSTPSAAAEATSGRRGSTRAPVAVTVGHTASTCTSRRLASRVSIRVVCLSNWAKLACPVRTFSPRRFISPTTDTTSAWADRARSTLARRAAISPASSSCGKSVMVEDCRNGHRQFRARKVLVRGRTRLCTRTSDGTWAEQRTPAARPRPAL